MSYTIPYTYVSIASTPTDQPCDQDILLPQSKGSCDTVWLLATYMCCDFVNRSTDV